MAQGFLGGIFWGCVVSIGVTSVASVVADGPAGVQTATVVDAIPSDTVTDGSDVETVLSADQADQIEAEDSTKPPAAQAETGTKDAVADLETAQQPPKPEAPDALSTPNEPDTDGSIAVGADTPVIVAPQSKLSEAPAEPSNLAVTTQAPEPPAVPDATDALPVETPRADTGTTQAPNPEIDTPDTAETAPSADDPEGSPQPDVQIVQTPVEDEGTATTPDVSEPATQDTPEVAEDEGADDTGPQIARPTIGKPAGTLEDFGQTVTVNRLPNLSSSNDAPDTGVDPDLETDPSQQAAGDLPPIQRFASAFENPDDKPMMAIVLIDEGQDLNAQTVGLAALRSFPYPISIAVDPNKPDAAGRMKSYRDEGFEVLVLVDLPERANATDAEVSIAAAFDVIPQAVAVIEGTGTGVQTTRAAADQVTAILAQSGHGFVTRNQGLNTVQKMAQRSGVPSAIVFRDFDNKDQTPTVIRRFLDQAAFRAGQEGAVIMLGRIRPDTISALLLWGLQDRAAQVAMAPVSAVLTREQ